MEKNQDRKTGKTLDNPGQVSHDSSCMIKSMRERYGIRPLFIAARLILGGVFLYAGFEKILHPAAFAEIIFNYRILPDVLTPFAAVVLPWLEVFVGLALFLGMWLPGAVFLCNLLLVIFLGALAFNLTRGLAIHCGCFGTNFREGSHEPMAWYLARDAVFFIPAFYLFMHIFFMKK